MEEVLGDVQLDVKSPVTEEPATIRLRELFARIKDFKRKPVLIDDSGTVVPAKKATNKGRLMAIPGGEEELDKRFYDPTTIQKESSSIDTDFDLLGQALRDSGAIKPIVSDSQSHQCFKMVVSNRLDPRRLCVIADGDDRLVNVASCVYHRAFICDIQVQMAKEGSFGGWDRMVGSWVIESLDRQRTIIDRSGGESGLINMDSYITDGNTTNLLGFHPKCPYVITKRKLELDTESGRILGVVMDGHYEIGDYHDVFAWFNEITAGYAEFYEIAKDVISQYEKDEDKELETMGPGHQSKESEETPRESEVSLIESSGPDSPCESESESGVINDENKGPVFLDELLGEYGIQPKEHEPFSWHSDKEEEQKEEKEEETLLSPKEVDVLDEK
jgi:hypothetical protein